MCMCGGAAMQVIGIISIYLCGFKANNTRLYDAGTYYTQPDFYSITG